VCVCVCVCVFGCQFT